MADERGQCRWYAQKRGANEFVGFEQNKKKNGREKREQKGQKVGEDKEKGERKVEKGTTVVGSRLASGTMGCETGGGGGSGGEREVGGRDWEREAK